MALSSLLLVAFLLIVGLVSSIVIPPELPTSNVNPVKRTSYCPEQSNRPLPALRLLLGTDQSWNVNWEVPSSECV